MHWLSKAVRCAETDQSCEGRVKQGQAKNSKGKARKSLHCKGRAEKRPVTEWQRKPGHRKGRVMKRKARALIGLVKAKMRGEMASWSGDKAKS